MFWYVYIVECKDKAFYVGLTANIERRIAQHNNGFYKGNFTKGRLPVKLVYWEIFTDKHVAALREKEIKDWRREKKINLIAKFTSSLSKINEKAP